MIFISIGLLCVATVNKDSNKDILGYYPARKLFTMLTIKNDGLMCYIELSGVESFTALLFLQNSLRFIPAKFFKRSRLRRFIEQNY